MSAVGLSPTLVERYLTAAQKVTRLARRQSRPGARQPRRRAAADLTQEEHVDGLPFGTRGGTAVRHTFPRDGVYEIQVRLMRNRNENVEGLTEPHEIEITLDGERLELFTVTPNRNRLGDYYADEGVDKHLQLRDARHRRPARGRRDVPAEARARCIETERQPYVAHFNMNRHPRLQPAVHSVSIAGPFDAGGVGDTPSRSGSSSAARRRRADGSRLRPADRDGIRAPRLSASGHRREIVAVPLEFYDERRSAHGRVRGRHRDGAARAPDQPGVPVPRSSAIRRARPRVRRIASAMSSWRRACRSSCGAAFPTTSC